jgi:hypothetical protein
MDFKLGEFVRFVDERREGYITKIFDDQMIGVTGDDDFEIPVPANKVTRVHGHTYQGVENQALEEKAISKAEFTTHGVYLAVAPDAAKGSVVYFYLVNESSYQLLATLSSEKGDTQKGLFAGIIAPHSSAKVFTASLTELSNWPKFSIQTLFYSGQDAGQKEPLVYVLKFSAKNFSGAKKELKAFKQQAWTFRIDTEEVVIDAQKLKESFFKPAHEKNEIERPAKEVDLHIEKLRDDHQFLSKDEILKIQLNHFQRALDAAIVHKLPSIIFIHGVGNGTLRQAIHKTVGKHQQVKTFMDAHKERYGYGATEVILK